MNRTLLLLALACGCAPRLYVNVLKPAPVNLGPTKRLSVLEVQGRASARDELLKELTEQTARTGYFTFSDRLSEGLLVKVSGTQAECGGLKADEVGLRIDLLEWNAEKQSTPTREKDKQGKPVTREKWVSQVSFAVTACAASGRTFLTEKRYVSGSEHDNDEDEAIRRAASDAIGRLLDDVTPSFENKAIVFDDTEEAQRPVIDLARDGQLQQAVAAERAVLGKTPHNASALYNLAVLLDAQGQYREALELYEEAIKLSPKPLYAEMKGECAQRLADFEAMAK